MRFAFFLVPFAVAASCGGMIESTSDAGNDAAQTGATCSIDSDCTSGLVCVYPVNDGCSATKHCLAPPKQGACKPMTYCACDGTSVGVCSAGAPKPVAHAGPCTEPPPPDCGPACEVCDVTGFAVSPQSKPSDATNACSSQDISSFVTACLSASATQTTCSTWEQGDAGKSACGACVLTQTTSATWGPIVCDSTTCTINTGGCIDIVAGQVAIENGTNGSCGDLTNAADECVDYACGACTDSSDSTTCTQDAQQVECKSYFDAAATASTCALFDAGAGTCSPQNDADWASFINVFCGTGP